jgi:hypothetical protein
MSTPTPLNGTGLGSIFSFITQSSYQIQLLIVGGLVIIVFVSIAVYFNKFKRRK